MLPIFSRQAELHLRFPKIRVKILRDRAEECSTTYHLLDEANEDRISECCKQDVAEVAPQMTRFISFLVTIYLIWT